MKTEKILWLLLLSFLLILVISGYAKATVKYSVGNDRITVTGNETLYSVYQADVSGGWNQITLSDTNVYTIDCLIRIADGNTMGNLTIENNVTNLIKDIDTNNPYFEVYDNKGYLEILNSTFYCKDDTQGFKFIENDHYLKIYQSSYFNYYANIGHIKAQNNGLRLYIDDSIAYGIDINTGAQSNMKFMINNTMFFGDNVRATVCLNSDMEFVNCTFKDKTDCGIYAYVQGSGDFINLTGIRFENCAYAVRIFNFKDYFQFIDCSFINTPYISRSGTELDTYVSNTFNLQTDTNARVTLFNRTGSIVFNVSSGNDGNISEQIVRCIVLNQTKGNYYHTPFTLRIVKDGYVTYNHSFNNSLQPMNYQIFLISEDSLTIIEMSNIIIDPSFYFALFFILIVLLMFLRVNPIEVFLLSLFVGLIGFYMYLEIDTFGYSVFLMLFASLSILGVLRTLIISFR